MHLKNWMAIVNDHNAVPVPEESEEEKKKEFKRMGSIERFINERPKTTMGIIGAYFVIDVICGFRMIDISNRYAAVHPGQGLNTYHGIPPPYGIPFYIAHKVFGFLRL